MRQSQYTNTNSNLTSAGGMPAPVQSGISKKDIANLIYRLGLPALGGAIPLDPLISPPLAALGDSLYEQETGETVSPQEKGLNAALAGLPGVTGEVGRTLALGAGFIGKNSDNFDNLDELFPNSTSFDDAFSQATKPQDYKPAGNIFDGFKNFFKQKPTSTPTNIDLPSVGLGNSLAKSEIDNFSKEIGINGTKDINKFGNALVNDVAPTLNKADANPFGFDTYAQNPFISTEQRLASPGSPLSIRKELLMSSPLDDFTNEAITNFNQQDSNLDNYFGTAYDTIKNKYGEVKAPTNRIVDTIDQGYGSIGNVSDKSSYPVFRKKADAIRQDAVRLANSSGAPFDWLKQNRTDLNDAMKKFSGAEGVQGQERNLLRQLRDSFTDGFSDLTDEAIKKGGDPDTLDNLKKVNKQYAEYKTAIKSPVGESLEKMAETGKTPKNISDFVKQFNTEEDVKAYTKLTKIPRQKLTDQVYGSILDEQFNPSAYAQRTDGITAPGQKLYTQGFDANTNTASVKRLHTALTKNRKNLIAVGGKEAYLDNVSFVNALNKISNKGKAWENIFRGIDNTSNKGKRVQIDTSQLDNLVAKNPNLFSPDEKMILNKVVGLNNRFSENQSNAKLKILHELLKKGVPGYGTVTDIGGKFTS
jgi:hypothetical protein